MGERTRRHQARERARAMREAIEKSERRRRWALRSGIATVVAAMVAAVALVLLQMAPPPPGPGPRNVASDGIRIGEGLVATRTAALAADDRPTPWPTSSSTKVADIRLYVDYQCPGCAAFEAENGEYLEGLVRSGAATLDIHPIAILDRFSQGSKYSTRAAAAAACVADLSPDSFFRANAALFADQPAESTAGLTNAQLASIVTGVEGVTRPDEIRACVTTQRFGSWVTASTKRALSQGAGGTDVAKISATPTVIVNGKLYDAANGPFTDFVTSAVAASESR